MKNDDKYYSGEYASEEIQEKAERFMKELREQHAQDPDSINRRPDSMLCHYLLSLKDKPPGEKIRLLKMNDATAEYNMNSPKKITKQK